METNSGVWLDRTLRVGACGTWWSAGTASGQPVALLQLEPELITQPAARDRIATAVAAVRSVNPSGVLRTTDLMIDARRAWLVVAGVPHSTVADLLAAHPVLPPGAAAGLAVDVAAVLRGLHAVGLGHGALTADTVVVTKAGSATLAEVGVLAAARGVPTDIGRDVAAWSTLARTLAAAATVPEADLLLTAAATAEAGDLVAATRRLALDAGGLPDFDGRTALAALVASAGPPAARAPRPRPRSDPSDPSDRSTMEAGSGILVRFGRGVPEMTVTGSTRRGAAPARWLRRLVSAAAVLALVLAAGAWWLLR